MASNLTAAAGQPLNSTPLSTLSGTLQGGINSLANTGTNVLDKFFPPARRNELKGKLSKFAAEKPYLASFLLSQIALSGFPIALFATFTVGVGVFALLAALIVAVLGAVLFTVFMAGVALIVLLPTLFVTTFAAAFIWLWGVGAYYFIKWFNEKPIPGVHKDIKGSLKDSTGLKAIQANVNDIITDQKVPAAEEQGSSGRPDGQHQPQQEQKQQHNSNGTSPTANTTNTTQQKPKPKPLSEKKDGANTPAAKRVSEPSNDNAAAATADAIITKTPVGTTKATTGTDIANVGGDLKKKTPIGGALGGITGTAGAVPAGIAT